MLSKALLGQNGNGAHGWSGADTQSGEPLERGDGPERGKSGHSQLSAICETDKLCAANKGSTRLTIANVRGHSNFPPVKKNASEGGCLDNCPLESCPGTGEMEALAERTSTRIPWARTICTPPRGPLDPTMSDLATQIDMWITLSALLLLMLMKPSA